jgi:uroporphyrinogen decarboxylase
VPSLFEAACRREPVERTPVWFMRQAGRYMEQYRAVRSRHTILEMCKRPAIAAEVTLQPVAALGVDAAIIFADLLLPAEPMGLKLEFVAGEGPHIANPVRTAADVAALESNHIGDLGYVAEAIQLVRRSLDGKIPVIGFVGAPFTLGSYLIEGGASRHYLHTKRMMFGTPELWSLLMEKLVSVLASYARLQATAGAAAIQVFDSWAGALAPGDYYRYVLPHSRALIRSVRSAGVPVIHFATGVGSYYPMLHKAGADVLGLDWRVELDQIWRSIRYRAGVQGNLDPAALFAPLKELRIRVEDILSRAGRRPGHIFNLGHGILPETPVENVKAVVEMVHEYGAS